MRQLKVVAMNGIGQRASSHAKWKKVFSESRIETPARNLLHSVDNQLPTSRVFSLGYLRHSCYRNIFFLLCLTDATVNTQISSLEDTSKLYLWYWILYITVFLFLEISIYIYKSSICRYPELKGVQAKRWIYLVCGFFFTRKITNLLNYIVAAWRT